MRILTIVGVCSVFHSSHSFSFFFFSFFSFLFELFTSRIRTKLYFGSGFFQILPSWIRIRIHIDIFGIPDLHPHKNLCGSETLLLSPIFFQSPTSRIDNDLYILINNVTRYSTWIGGPNWEHHVIKRRKLQNWTL